MLGREGVCLRPSAAEVELGVLDLAAEVFIRPYYNWCLPVH
jgi:hypothetical protein